MPQSASLPPFLVNSTTPLHPKSLDGALIVASAQMGVHLFPGGAESARKSLQRGVMLCISREDAAVHDDGSPFRTHRRRSTFQYDAFLSCKIFKSLNSGRLKV